MPLHCSTRRHFARTALRVELPQTNCSSVTGRCVLFPSLLVILLVAALHPKPLAGSRADRTYTCVTVAVGYDTSSRRRSVGEVSCWQTYVVLRFRHTTAYDPTPLAPGRWGGLFKVLILSSQEGERQRGLRSNGPVCSRNRPIVRLRQECYGAVPRTAHPTPDLPPVPTFLVIRKSRPPSPACGGTVT